MIPYMVGKLAPNSSHLTRGLVKYVPGRVYFRAVFSQNGDKFVTSPPSPSVERVTDDQGHRHFHDVMWARVQLVCTDFSAWVNVCQGLRRRCVMSPLLLNTVFAAVIKVVLQRFVEEPLIVSDLLYLYDAPKSEDGRLREERTLEMVRRAL